MKSNIKLPSNIYVRTGNIESDTNYIQQISGYSALKKWNQRYMGGTLSSAAFSLVQREESAQAPSCTFAKNKEHTHGKVYIDGCLQYVGRCEFTKCSRYNRCESTRIVNRTAPPTLTQGSAPLPFDMDLLSKLPNIEAILSNQNKTSFEQPIFDSPKEPVMSPTFEPGIQFNEASNTDEIIASSIDSKILVNAGPGTGKTYCAVQRIIYLLKNDLIAPDKIVMLCYSRAAVAVIRNRIQQAIDSGVLPAQAADIILATFDSFAGGYLHHILHEKAPSYNEAIALFNKKMQADDFKSDTIGYFIVDEMQDIVDERAKMTLNILNAIECGYLLLGDKCQAIYDFETAPNAMSTQDFYALLQAQLSETMCYEFSGNRRQCKTLADQTAILRNILLRTEENQQFSAAESCLLPLGENTIKQKHLAEISFTDYSAILCHTNGEVLMVSNQLSEHGIPHTVYAGSQKKNKIRRDFADILWDYTDEEISLKEFQRRYNHRVKEDSSSAKELFDTLVSLSSDCQSDILQLRSLRTALMNTQLEVHQSLTIPDHPLVVSTIHRAKGREFDHIYLLTDPKLHDNYKTASYVRRIYVALTRARHTATLVERPRSWMFHSQKHQTRPYKISYKSKTYFWCSGIGISQDSHIDTAAFACLNTPEENISIQAYIASHVAQYDIVQISLNNNNQYILYHNEHPIGCLGTDSVQQFWSIINETRNRNAIPKKLENLHISNIYTVIDQEYHENLSTQHQKSGIWLGLEITGMGIVKGDAYS